VKGFEESIAQKMQRDCTLKVKFPESFTLSFPEIYQGKWHVFRAAAFK
jgi:hypothetical protein